jgi:hypothetical protein
MSARKIQDENDAKDCIERMKASGLTLTAWARAEGVDGRSVTVQKSTPRLRRRNE